MSFLKSILQISTLLTSRRVEYLPFGETLVEEHLNSNNSPFKFNAKELDEETGNYYYGARYYDPKLSIWLSVDPLAEKYPSFSSYAYTLQNPVRFVDPTGMVVESPDDWVYDKKNEIYVWKEEVYGPEDIANKKRYEYVGVSNGDVNNHYEDNNNWFVALFTSPKKDLISFSNYIDNEINSRIETALASYESGNLANIDMNIRGLKENVNSTNPFYIKFDLDITLDNNKINGYRGTFHRRNDRSDNKLTSISAYMQKFNGKDSKYDNPGNILFFSPGKREEAIIQFHVSKKDFSVIEKYLTKKHYENKK